MPDQLAQGLGDTYERIVEARANDVRDARRDAPMVETPELSRVLTHQQAGEVSSPFESEAQRENFRTEVARVLEETQVERLKDGDSDALAEIIEDRLDRLYVAKVYLQSDSATAHSDALRQVVDDIADIEYEKNRAADVDGETERGQVH